MREMKPFSPRDVHHSTFDRGFALVDTDSVSARQTHNNDNITYHAWVSSETRFPEIRRDRVEVSRRPIASRPRIVTPFDTSSRRPEERGGRLVGRGGEFNPRRVRIIVGHDDDDDDDLCEHDTAGDRSSSSRFPAVIAATSTARSARDDETTHGSDHKGDDARTRLRRARRLPLMSGEGGD